MTQKIQSIIAVKLWCPYCGARHIDETRNGERWDRRAHTTHRCQSCGGDFDVYVSGAPDEAVKVETAAIDPGVIEILMKPTEPPKQLTWASCGCLITKHGNHENYLAAGAERDGRTCKLGWPL